MRNSGENLPSGVSFVIPVYNSEGTLETLAQRLEKAMQSDGRAFEVILVEDGSRDKSWEVVEKLSRQYSFIHGVRLMRNYGQHNALLCGIRLARYDTIVTMDDDLQNPPEEVPQLLAALKEGVDVVYGPPEEQKHGVLRGLASSITKIALQGAMGAEAARHVSAFRAFRTQIREAFAEFRGPFPSIDVLLTWGARRFEVRKVKQDERTIGQSNYTFFKLVLHALNMITGFSTLPLQVTGLIGFFFSLFGMAVLAYVLIRYMVTDHVVTGFPFLASIIAIFSGAQMFALGVLGEYLARIHFRTMERPAYAIRTQTESGS